MSQAHHPPVVARYSHTRAIIRLHGAIDNHTIFALCDEINLAIDYYHYDEIEIQIDSFGGAIASLEYYLRQLAYWRAQRHIRIATLALTTAASAAAVMLSLGDIGHRRAYASSSLLYHDSRVFSDQATLTPRALEHLRRKVLAADTLLLDALTRHIYQGKALVERDADGQFCWRSMLTVRPGIEALTPWADPAEILVEQPATDNQPLSLEQLRRAYQALNALDVFITADQARRMLLIDEVIAEEVGYGA